MLISIACALLSLIASLGLIEWVFSTEYLAGFDNWIESLATLISSASILQLGGALLFLLVQVVTAVVCFSAVSAAYVLSPYRVAFVVLGAVFYVFAFLILPTLFIPYSEWQELRSLIVRGHIWVFVVLLPVATFYLYRAALKDRDSIEVICEYCGEKRTFDSVDVVRCRRGAGDGHRLNIGTTRDPGIRSIRRDSLGRDNTRT